jgi:hypothetical protein
MYTDTPDDDWVIGYYTSDLFLMIATGGSGRVYEVICTPLKMWELTRWLGP